MIYIGLYIYIYIYLHVSVLYPKAVLSHRRCRSVCSVFGRTRLGGGGGTGGGGGGGLFELAL